MWRVLNAHPPKTLSLPNGRGARGHDSLDFCSCMALSVEDSAVVQKIYAAMQIFSWWKHDYRCRCASLMTSHWPMCTILWTQGRISCIKESLGWTSLMLSIPCFVLSSPDFLSPVSIDWPIMGDTNVEQPVVLMACSLIHTDTEQW